MDTRFLQSSTFRLALVYMALFGASVLLLLGFIYWSTASYMSRQTDLTIDVEIDDLTERYRIDGLKGLTELMKKRLSRQPGGSSVYLLTDKDLKPLLGNLDRWPVNATLDHGWLDFELDGVGDDRGNMHHARARVFRLEGGYLLLVGRDIHDLEITKQRIVLTLLWGLAITLLLGGAGSIMMGRSSMRRIEAINATSREIMSGDLSRRIPSRNTGDDFDLLAANLNRMLDQIESLMESVRRVSDNIAHDLRTPLARLRNHLEELNLNADRPDEDHVAIEQALAEADGLLSTFQALLRIAHVEAQESRENFSPVDISALVADVAELYEPLAEQKQQRLSTYLAPGVRLYGDRDLLFQAVSNLVDNAIKYTPSQGSIRLTLEPADGSDRLVIADSGPGIPEAAREKVLQRFFRLEQSRTTPGNGLGMSLVAAVIRLHRLTLRLEDNCPGLRVIIGFPPAE
ncbi:MAG: HAMP domain-containing sensor histidine kinase [Gammaproteobacteria bacterium]|jgi:signal transduction histidine kinase